MKKILSLSIVLLVLTACSNTKEKSVEDVIASENLSEIIKHKDVIIAKQQINITELKLLNEKIAELDTNKKMKLVSTFIVKDTIFKHYLELQGNVNTKNLLTIYPEYSGILTDVLVKEGQVVRKGQLLAKIGDGGLSQQLSQLTIQANLSKTTYERQARLWEQKIGSEIQYLQAKSNFEGQQKAVSQMRQQLAKTNIKAPFSGTIDEILTEQGSVVAPGSSAIIRIVNLKDMYIEADVSEQHITKVTKGKNVLINFPVLGKTLNATIRQAGSYINPANRTFKIEIAVPNKDQTIKPNLTAKLKINDYTNPKALLIPQSIISENANGEQYLYTLKNKKDNTAIVVKTIIQTGLAQDDSIEVLSGLTPNTEIITEGARTVKEDQKVEIIN